MYRLVVILMTLSLPGSEAAGSEPESSSFLGNDQNPEIGPLVLEGSPLQKADDLMATVMEYPEFVVASYLSRGLSSSNEGGAKPMSKLLADFAGLKTIAEDIQNDSIVCSKIYLDQLLEFEQSLNDALGGRLNKIDADLDLLLFRKFSEMEEKYFTYCMPKLKRGFDIKSNDPEFIRMRDFEIFIDEEKAAQTHGTSRYCNDEIKVLDWVNYWKLASKIGTEGGMEPAIALENTNYFEVEERGKLMRDFFSSTCENLEFDNLIRDAKFIMSAKRSVKFNRDWNLMFDCGENVGRFQLCQEAVEKFFEF